MAYYKRKLFAQGGYYLVMFGDTGSSRSPSVNGQNIKTKYGNFKPHATTVKAFKPEQLSEDYWDGYYDIVDRKRNNLNRLYFNLNTPIAKGGVKREKGSVAAIPEYVPVASGATYLGAATATVLASILMLN